MQGVLLPHVWQVFVAKNVKCDMYSSSTESPPSDATSSPASVELSHSSSATKAVSLSLLSAILAAASSQERGESARHPSTPCLYEATKGRDMP